VGLPPVGQDNWDIFRPILADPNLAPSKSDITFASTVFREFLEIRKSSQLFRLQTAQDVMSAVKFLNTGPDQIPGLIVMHLMDTERRDKNYYEIIVLFNANPDEISFTADHLVGKTFSLHPIQMTSVDMVVRDSDFDADTGSFSIPGRTTAVFVIEETQKLNSTMLVIISLIAVILIGTIIVLLKRKRSSP
jgi:hypothetical protein